MEKSIRSIAMYFSVMIFFIMSIVGCFCGQSPATCCSRAVPGALVTYFAVSFAAKTVVKIMINEIIDAKVSQHGNKPQ